MVIVKVPVPTQRQLVTAALIITLAAAAIALYVVYTRVYIRNRGRIRAYGLEVYQDPACTTALTEIDWGILDPGEQKTVMAYIKNTGTDTGTLAMNLSEWDPDLAATYISLTCSLQGLSILPDQVLAAEFRLYVSPQIHDVREFSFVINIYLGR